jgi:hypothetical protein
VVAIIKTVVKDDGIDSDVLKERWI